VASVFVSGATGFIGRVVVRELLARGDRVVALTRTPRGAQILRQFGADPVFGDLLVRGPWQDRVRGVAKIVHLAQPAAFGARITKGRAVSYRERRGIMDRNLLEVLDPTRVERVVYVAGTSYYGNLGRELRDEGATPRPRGWGPYIAPAIEALDRYVAGGLPIVTAFPGYVYGDGSWFREYVWRPLRAGGKVSVLGGRSRMASPVHVGDCARALVCLLDSGAVGARYFVVDDEPLEWSAFHARAAEAMGVPLRVRRVPTIALRLLVGNVVVDSILSDANLSNARLKALGFALRFPSSREGLRDVVAGARPFRPGAS
jgi:nucleoside-diphosphate-sugar epimerase